MPYFKMKKFLNLSAKIVGSIAVITGLTACGGDDGPSGNECCTLSQGGYTYRVCEDGTYTYSGNGYSYTGSWTEEYGSWEEVKAEAISQGASCS